MSHPEQTESRRRRGFTAATIFVVVVLAAASVVGFVSYVPPQESLITRAVFIGDSYTHGTGATSDKRRWTSLVAAGRGWQEVNLGLGGTGYLATAGEKGCGRPFCPNYQTVAIEAVEDKPDVVVVAGGQNDVSALGSDPERVFAAVHETYRRLRSALPDAVLIAVGPSTTQQVGRPVRDLDAAVQDAAASVGAIYVSMIEPTPVFTAKMVLPDRGHVNDAGHKAIADRVLAAPD